MEAKAVLFGDEEVSNKLTAESNLWEDPPSVAAPKEVGKENRVPGYQRLKSCFVWVLA